MTEIRRWLAVPKECSVESSSELWVAQEDCGSRLVFFIVNGFALWSFLTIARLVLITLPSDGAIVSIVHKYVEAGTVPEKWDLPVV